MVSSDRPDGSEREDRERLAKIVEMRAICFAIEEVDAETIDRVNIYQASKLAMIGAVARLMPAADHLPGVAGLTAAAEIDTSSNKTEAYLSGV